MELIVAVYDDWGIGKDGTQPVKLKADRRFFAKYTDGAVIIAGRKTAEDFPKGEPLPNRVNVLLTRSGGSFPGFHVADNVWSIPLLDKCNYRTIVVGGGSVYDQLLPYCTKAVVTKIHCRPESDTFFHDLDEDPQWRFDEVLETGTEDGIDYEIRSYSRKKN